MRANFVGRSIVSAITQTPASGPFTPVTTPPMSSPSMGTAPRADCWALSVTAEPAQTAAIAIATTPRYSAFFIFMAPLLSGKAAGQRPGDSARPLWLDRRHSLVETDARRRRDGRDAAADLPGSPDRAGHDVTRARRSGRGRAGPDHPDPADGYAKRGRSSVRHPARWPAAPGDVAPAGGHRSVPARHGIPALRARAAGRHPGGFPRGLGPARRAQRARHERRAGRSADDRAILRAL